MTIFICPECGGAGVHSATCQSAHVPSTSDPNRLVEDAETRCMLAMERIATALETLVAERARPKNTKRIRAEFVRVTDGSPRMVVFRVAGATRVALGDFTQVSGLPHLWRDDGERVLDVNDDACRYEIEVPLVAVYDPKKPRDGMPEWERDGYRPVFIVTVDLQPDPATWGWREWVRL